jgi:hypothetical protein
MMTNLRNQKETQTNLTMEPLWKHQVVLSEVTVGRVGSGKSSMAGMQTMFPYYLLYHHAVRHEVGEKAPPEEEREEEVEEATIIGLVIQMSHWFPRFPLSMTHMTVLVGQVAVIPSEGMV